MMKNYFIKNLKAAILASVVVLTLVFPFQLDAQGIFFSETFAGTFPPAGWSIHGGLLPTNGSPVTLGPVTSAYSWKTASFANNPGSPRGAVIDIFGSVSVREWLITPEIDFGTTGSAILEFDMAFVKWGSRSPADGTRSDDQFMVLVSQDGVWTLQKAVAIWNNVRSRSLNAITSSPSGEHVEVQIQGIKGNARIAFYAESTISNGDNDLFIGNVLLTNGSTATVNELSDASVCAGGSHTFEIAATGTNLTYQWYKGNNPILGPSGNGNKLTISNATKEDYELYYVVIKNNVGTRVSNKVRLWVAEPLPEHINLTEYPNPAVVGASYPLAIAGHPDVTKYTWSSTFAGATFTSQYEKNKANVIFSGAGIGNGKILVEMEHVCGNRIVSQDVMVKYPTGIEDIANNKTWVGPNPVTTELRIENGNLKIENVVVVNAAGQNIYQANPKSSNVQINTAYWPKGIYLVKVTTGLQGKNSTKSYKIIKN